jgi:two-component system, NarL family, sensor histidine kinase UhpB
VIDTLGIASALAEMVRQFDRMHPTCRVAFDRSPAFPDLQGTLAITAYRVTQEALTNIGKHARAKQARVALGIDPETGGAQIIVEDNGCGFESGDASARGLGLIGIKERVFSVGGSVVLRAGLGRGTFLCITLPAGLGAGAN